MSSCTRWLGGIWALALVSVLGIEGCVGKSELQGNEDVTVHTGGVGNSFISAGGAVSAGGVTGLSSDGGYYQFTGGSVGSGANSGGATVKGGMLSFQVAGLQAQDTATLDVTDVKFGPRDTNS